MFPVGKETLHAPIQATDGPHENVEFDSPYASAAMGAVNVPDSIVAQSCRYPQYVDEQSRLESYSNWPHPAAVQDVRKLARYGLFYSGPDDVVRCFQCGLGMRDWSTMDDSLYEHIKNSLNCQYLASVVEPSLLQMYKARTISRNPDLLGAEQQRQAGRHRHPDFAGQETRQSTFSKWPSDRVQTPNLLAEAGFFYTGMADRVRCYSCDGGLQHWDTDDDPWIEHARYFPHCEHVKTVKGDNFIRLVQIAIEGSDGENDDDDATNDITNDMNKLTVNGASGGSRESDDPIYTPAAQNVIATFGFSMEAVKMAIKECTEKGVRWNQDVLANVLLDKLDQSETLPSDSPRPQPQTHRPVDLSTREGLLTERKTLLSRLKCFQCGDNDANILFLPCAHKKLCKSCCEHLSRCPICDKPVKEKIQTFMA